MGSIVCPNCNSATQSGSICDSCECHVFTLTNFEPLVVDSPEEFANYEIVIESTLVRSMLEPALPEKVRTLFARAMLISERRKKHPIEFAHSRVNSSGAFVKFPDGVIVDDGKSHARLYENGYFSLISGLRVNAAINAVAEYVKVLKNNGLYSRTSFAVDVVSIAGTAKVPVGFLRTINLQKAAYYLAEAVFNSVEAPFLVYNMKAMDVQLYIWSNGQVRFLTRVKESNVARAVRLLQESIKLEKDVSVMKTVEKPTQQDKFVYCVGCGARLSPTATYCRSCGARQPEIESSC